MTSSSLHYSTTSPSFFSPSIRTTPLCVLGRRHNQLSPSRLRIWRCQSISCMNSNLQSLHGHINASRRYSLSLKASIAQRRNNSHSAAANKLSRWFHCYVTQISKDDHATDVLTQNAANHQSRRRIIICTCDKSIPHLYCCCAR
jgi:hypothetical protein